MIISQRRGNRFTAGSNASSDVPSWTLKFNGKCMAYGAVQGGEYVAVEVGYNNLEVVEGATGKKLWRKPIDEASPLNTTVRALFLSDGRLFVQPDKEWICFDLLTGDRVELPDQVSGVFLLGRDGEAFFGAENDAREDFLLALDCKSLKTRSIETNRFVIDDFEAKFLKCDYLSGNVVLADRIEDGEEWIVTDIENRAVQLAGTAKSGFVLFDREAFVIHDWKGAVARELPVPCDLSHLYVCSFEDVDKVGVFATNLHQKGQLIGVDLSSGEVVWSSELGEYGIEDLCGNEDRVWVIRDRASPTASIVALSRSTGKVLAEYSGEGYWNVLPTESGLYALGANRLAKL